MRKKIKILYVYGLTLGSQATSFIYHLYPFLYSQNPRKYCNSYYCCSSCYHECSSCYYAEISANQLTGFLVIGKAAN